MIGVTGPDFASAAPSLGEGVELKLSHKVCEVKFCLNMMCGKGVVFPTQFAQITR